MPPTGTMPASATVAGSAHNRRRLLVHLDG